MVPFFQMDMLTIVTALVLQDLPFFCLRMTLIFKYLGSPETLFLLFFFKKNHIKLLRFRVISHMNIFFTAKNSLVILMQMYRLLVLCLERRPQYRRQSRLFSLIPQVRWS